MHFVVFVKLVWMPGEMIPWQFYHDAMIPFVPFIGMSISVRSPPLDRSSFGPVTSITWYEHKRAFFLSVEDDSSMLGDVSEWERITKEQKVDFLETEGWILYDRNKEPDFWFSVEDLAMSKATVYYFERYDIQTDQMIRSKRPATRETIARCNCVAIEGTAQEVDVSRLDNDGFLAKTQP